MNNVYLFSREDLAAFLDIPYRHLTYLLYVKKTENSYFSPKLGIVTGILAFSTIMI